MHTQNKWAITAAGVIVMMTIGSIYSWSVFTQPLAAAFAWSNTTTTTAFALAIFSLGIGAVIGGRLQDRLGPRLVTLIGVSLWGTGNILAGVGTPSLGAAWLYATYGVLGGFGVGMSYVTPVATVIKWFRERRGFAGGLVVTGFGLGAVAYNLIITHLPGFGAAASAATEYTKAQTAAMAAYRVFEIEYYALTQEQVQAIMNVFVASGFVYLLLGGACAWLLTNPPARRASDQPETSEHEHSFTTREMLRTPQFYHLWLMLFANVTAGILVIGNAVPIMQELAGLTPQHAASLYAGVALFNAMGRFLWGAVSDRVGRRAAFGAIFLIQAVIFMVMGGLQATSAVTIAYAIVLLCFGGGFGTMPSFNADYFGTQHVGANYGAILTAWGCAGVAGPLFASYVKDATGSYSGALLPVAAMLLLATLLPMITRKPVASTSTADRRDAVPDPALDNPRTAHHDLGAYSPAGD